MYVKFLNISDDDDHVQAEKIKTLKLCYESNLHEFIMALDDFSQASDELALDCMVTNFEIDHFGGHPWLIGQLGRSGKKFS